MSHFPDIPDELLARLDITAPRYTSYPTVPVWSAAFGPEDHAAALERAAEERDAPLSLYVHIPFCREMCTYCGCNVIVTKDVSRADRYLDALEAEIGLVADRLEPRRGVSRLHLGGGTPTFLDERQLERLWRMLADRFVIEPDAELAIEIDPAVTRTTQLDLLRGLGFRRLSMGVQDFDPRVQRAVNRIQSEADTRALVAHARASGWGSLNLDLIYGLPFQTPESFARTVDAIVDIRPERVSLFSFAHVPSLKPHQRLLPIADLPSGAAKLAIFRMAHDRLVDAGWRAIGLDHFALPDDELARAQDDGRLWRDFQGYTVQRAADTIGLGVSSIGFAGGAYVQNVKSLKAHEDRVAAGILPTDRGLRLSDDDLRRRRLITMLMCNPTVELPDAPEVDAARPQLGRLADDGLLRLDGARLTLTPLGRLFARNVASLFDAYLPAARAASGKRGVFSRTV